MDYITTDRDRYDRDLRTYEMSVANNRKLNQQINDLSDENVLLNQKKVRLKEAKKAILSLAMNFDFELDKESITGDFRGTKSNEYKDDYIKAIKSSHTNYIEDITSSSNSVVASISKKIDKLSDNIYSNNSKIEKCKNGITNIKRPNYANYGGD